MHKNIQTQTRRFNHRIVAQQGDGNIVVLGEAITAKAATLLAESLCGGQPQRAKWLAEGLCDGQPQMAKLLEEGLPKEAITVYVEKWIGDASHGQWRLPPPREGGFYRVLRRCTRKWLLQKRSDVADKIKGQKRVTSRNVSYVV